MSERVTAIDRGVSTRLLKRAVIRLDSRRHPEKITEIQRVLTERERERWVRRAA